MFAANPQFEQVAHNPPLDETDFNGTPAMVDGRIYLRSDQALYYVATSSQP